MTTDELRARIESIDFYHSMDLMGIPTPGKVDCHALFSRLGLPADMDLTGKRAIDLGTRDGVFAFWAEARGAEVLTLDYPGEWGEARRGRSAREGFDLVHEVLGSKVEPIEGDLDDPHDWPTDRGPFDLILMLGLLYHLRGPILALERAAGMLAAGGLLVVETAVGLLDLPYPAARIWAEGELLDDPTNWSSFNSSAIMGLLKRFGLEPRQIGGISYCPRGNHRAVFHGVKRDATTAP
jgi:tRNA (mo5U34)-methyltransferase